MTENTCMLDFIWMSFITIILMVQSASFLLTLWRTTRLESFLSLMEMTIEYDVELPTGRERKKKRVPASKVTMRRKKEPGS